MLLNNTSFKSVLAQYTSIWEPNSLINCLHLPQGVVTNEFESATTAMAEIFLFPELIALTMAVCSAQTDKP